MTKYVACFHGNSKQNIPFRMLICSANQLDGSYPCILEDFERDLHDLVDKITPFFVKVVKTGKYGTSCSVTIVEPEKQELIDEFLSKMGSGPSSGTFSVFGILPVNKDDILCFGNKLVTDMISSGLSLETSIQADVLPVEVLMAWVNGLPDQLARYHQRILQE